MITYTRIGVMTYDVFVNGVLVGSCWRVRDGCWRGRTPAGKLVESFREARGSVAWLLKEEAVK